MTFQVSSLLDEKLKDALIEDVAKEYLEIREEYYECLKVIMIMGSSSLAIQIRSPLLFIMLYVAYC